MPLRCAVLCCAALCTGVTVAPRLLHPAGGSRRRLRQEGGEEVAPAWQREVRARLAALGSHPEHAAKAEQQQQKELEVAGGGTMRREAAWEATAAREEGEEEGRGAGEGAWRLRPQLLAAQAALRQPARADAGAGGGGGDAQRWRELQRRAGEVGEAPRWQQELRAKLAAMGARARQAARDGQQRLFGSDEEAASREEQADDAMLHFVLQGLGAGREQREEEEAAAAARLRLRLHQLHPGADSAAQEERREAADPEDASWQYQYRRRGLRQQGGADLSVVPVPSRLQADPVFAVVARAARLLSGGEPALSLVSGHLAALLAGTGP